MNPVLSLAIACVALLSACDPAPACDAADLRALEVPVAYAVVTSDYISTAVALLDGEGELVDEAWVDSGTTRAGIAASLSGDVVLPTEGLAGRLTLLDRFGVDLLTLIAVPEGTVLAQVPTQLAREDSPSGFRANPHDVVELEDGLALVSRYGVNVNVDAPPLDRGDDVILVNLATSELLGRFDFAHLDVAVGGTIAFARPERMARVGERVVVGLGRLDRSFMTSAPGAVAVLDPASGEVTAVPLEGLAGCGEVRRVPGDAERVMVLCSGTWTPDSEARRASVGVASVHVTADGAVAVEHLWRAAEHGEVPVPYGVVVPLGGARVALASTGSLAPQVPARAFALDLATGAWRDVVTDAGPFALGPGTFDPGTGLLLLPDSELGIRRFRSPGGLELVELPTSPVSPCRGLQAREVGALVAAP